MNLGSLFGAIPLLTGLFGGAALYAVGHIQGSKAAAKLTPKVADIESKVNTALGIAQAVQSLTGGHTDQLNTLNNAIGQATGKAEAALSTAVAKTLPPDLQGIVNGVIEAGTDAARQKIETMTSQAVQTITNTPLNVNVTQGLKASDLAQPQAPTKPPTAPEGQALP